MKRQSNALTTLILAFLGMFLIPAAAQAAPWVEYRSNKYGFTMQIPSGTQLATKELGGGWGALWGQSGPATLYAVAKLGIQHQADEIESFGVRVTGVPAQFWTKIAQGRNDDGWSWYRVYRANGPTHVVWAVLGTGPRGSYLLFEDEHRRRRAARPGLPALGEEPEAVLVWP